MKVGWSGGLDRWNNPTQAGSAPSEAISRSAPSFEAAESRGERVESLLQRFAEFSVVAVSVGSEQRPRE